MFKKYFPPTCVFVLLLVFVTPGNFVEATALAPVAVVCGTQENSAGESQSLINEDMLRKQLELGEGLSEREVIASQVVTEEFANQISGVEWLAPLAPVALSPFFGITLLSGLACYGSDWLPENALLSEGSPLANPAIFWTFLVLTVLTSAPRFSKVSKPIAQMADFLETYSAIVILLVLKAVSMGAFESSSTDVAVAEAGILSAGWEGFLMLAMAINIVVVNSVKFFFEILVWITPVPFLDACFEVANKTVCAALMAIYAFSPIAALILNLLIFAVCAFAFVWIRRREIFFRTMLIDWLMQKFFPKGAEAPEALVVFPKSEIGAIPARARCLLEADGDGWKLTHQRMLRSHLVEQVAGTAKLNKGWWTNSIDWADGARLTFSSKNEQQLENIAASFGLTVAEGVEQGDLQIGRQVEFA